ncbi:hypothetical protein H8E88_20825 [candidate division KSB1 bacterium]|nr:hypothetical protein [candidate division KSB1 bacterium]MBL7092624.1 hypothetical protein [candidate division KSB1 bacterium]
MIFPKGKAIHENLNTSFTNFEELLSDLKTNQITGYAHISFWDYEGVLFLDSGNIINAIEETENERNAGQEAIDNLSQKVKEKDGQISIYSLTPDLVLMLSGLSEVQLIHKELTNDFTNLEKLIQKIKDENQTGYLEVLDQDRISTALIFFQLGEPVESAVLTNGDTIHHSGIHPQIFEFVKTDDAMFNVYKAMHNPNSTNFYTSDKTKLFGFWNELIGAIESKFIPGTFIPAFKQALIDQADKYPFLDPFTNEFNYADGKITFEGKLNEGFNKGLSAALIDVTKQASISNLKIDIEVIKNSHQAMISNFGLETILEELIK